MIRIAAVALLASVAVAVALAAPTDMVTPPAFETTPEQNAKAIGKVVELMAAGFKSTQSKQGTRTKKAAKVEAVQAIRTISVEDVGVIRPEQAVSSPMECTLCEAMVKKAEAKLDSPDTISKVTAWGEAVCNSTHVPEAFRPECDAVIQKYVGQILEELANKVSPAEACSKLGACGNASNTQLAAFGVECALCEKTVEALKSKILSAGDMDTLKAWAKGVCTDIPGNLTPECDAAVDTYLIPAIEKLVTDTPDTFICGELKMCPLPVLGSVRSDLTGDVLVPGHWYHHLANNFDIKDSEMELLDPSERSAFAMVV